MPTAVTEPPALPEFPNPPRKRWTREECAQLAQAGMLDYERLELVEGDLIKKMPKNRPHSILSSMILEWLFGIFGSRFVQQETPIDLAPEDNLINEPIPDLVV